MIFSLNPVNGQNILITMDKNDSFAKSAVRHLNISKMFFIDKFRVDKISLDRFDFNETADINSLCDKMVNVSFVISVCRSSHSIGIVAELARISQVPTIQVDLNYWSLPLNFNDTSAPVVASPSYATMVLSTLVFQNVITDIFADLNITPNSTVLYDNIYPPDFTVWRGAFSVLPGVRFVAMETTVLKMRAQITQMRMQSINSLILVAKTENVERFTLEDITAFKCDSCESALMFWLRPFPVGKIMEIRDLDDYLFRNEIGLELDYSINGWDTLNVAFYMNVMGYAFETIREMNATFDVLPTFTCEAGPSEANITTTVREIILNDPAHEYGNYTESDGNVFFQVPKLSIIEKIILYFQNIEVRIYKIDRDRDHEDALFNKEVGVWTPLAKLSVMYGTLQVDVRNLNIFRVVTLIQPPFVQRTGDPNTPYEGYCIDLINMIQVEVNFTYTIYEVEDGSFGTMDDNGNWNGLIGALVSGSADIALAPLSVMAERENDVDFTVPYYDLVGTTILMKKADVEYSLFKFMKVLEWPVWLCIVAAYLFTSILLWIFDRFSPYSFTNNKERYQNDIEKRQFSLKECLWFCMTSLTPQGGGEAPKNISGRLVAATWWLFGFIIIASYTANLAAFLTVSRLEQPISSLDDLAKQYKIEYAPIKGSASETYFRRMAEIEETFYNMWKEMSLNESMSPRDRAKLAVWDYPVSDKFTNMWRYMQESKLPPDMDAAVDRVLNSVDGFAFIGDATEIKYAALTNCKLQQVGTEFSRKPYAIAVQSGHILKDKISSAILMLLNQRRLETLKEKWWTDNPNKVSCPDSSDESDGISIQNIGGVFIVILAGIALSIITLAFEYYYYKRKARKAAEKEKEQIELKVQQVIPNGVHTNGVKQEVSQKLNGTNGNGTAVQRIKRSNSVSAYENTAFQY
ncbi:CBN-GLR-7 protein [Caenorhabditis brenneri]|uniref:CBN-GLR-7 protein n=1 Tax=Caenorhabditis brenneri TaxID=135651 RepID=G0M762_CAEBE|nr:CBN-GLR-7 protein [Caenorhabditis brenneri]